MPLLTSPIDGSPMRQINRYGIEIDVCPTTGGIWLDKGELEKLMALLKEEAMNDQPAPYRSEQAPPGRAYRGDDDYDDDDRYKRGYEKGYKPKSKMSRMMDIFDF
jgi:uncharacterized protein